MVGSSKKASNPPPEPSRRTAARRSCAAAPLWPTYANFVLKWFHSEGEEEVEPARALLDAHKERTVALWTIPSLTETGLCGFGVVQLDATR